MTNYRHEVQAAENKIKAWNASIKEIKASIKTLEKGKDLTDYENGMLKHIKSELKAYRDALRDSERELKTAKVNYRNYLRSRGK